MKLFNSLPPYVWLDTLPEVNDEPYYVPLVERYAYCQSKDYLSVLEEMLVVYGLRLNQVMADLDRDTLYALNNLKLPCDEHVAVDLRGYGSSNVLYFTTRRMFRWWSKDQAVMIDTNCIAL